MPNQQSRARWPLQPIQLLLSLPSRWLLRVSVCPNGIPARPPSPLFLVLNMHIMPLFLPSHPRQPHRILSLLFTFPLKLPPPLLHHHTPIGTHIPPLPPRAPLRKSHRCILLDETNRQRRSRRILKSCHKIPAVGVFQHTPTLHSMPRHTHSSLPISLSMHRPPSPPRDSRLWT